MKFTLKNAHQFSWEGLKGWAYNSTEDFANASAAYFEVTGRHGKVKTTHSDRIYFVIAGEGEFIVGDETVLVKESDVVIIPQNMPYDYKAKSKVLKLFLVHTPAYDRDCEVRLEPR